METSNTDTYLFDSNTELTLVTPEPAAHILTVHGEQGRELARILPNGDVIMDESNANAAAKVFWSAIHFHRPRCPNCNSSLELI